MGLPRLLSRDTERDTFQRRSFSLSVSAVENVVLISSAFKLINRIWPRRDAFLGVASLVGTIGVILLISLKFDLINQASHREMFFSSFTSLIGRQSYHSDSISIMNIEREPRSDFFRVMHLSLKTPSKHAASTIGFRVACLQRATERHVFSCCDFVQCGNF
jgi:hypothetical protein